MSRTWGNNHNTRVGFANLRQYMNITKIIQRYLHALEIGKYKHMMNLFSKNAKIHSPLYGEITAQRFYKELFGDTSKSKITLINIFKGKNSSVGAGHFKYNWNLADGTPVSFECVDVFKFSKDDRIKELTIIYDTAEVRPNFKRMKSTRKKV